MSHKFLWKRACAEVISLSIAIFRLCIIILLFGLVVVSCVKSCFYYLWENIGEATMTADGSKVLQVTNISPSVTMEQLETLFGFLGAIDEMQVFPKTNTVPVSSKVAFVRFQSKSAVETGQHISNTVFIDKPIICVAYAEGKIPDESVAMQYVAPVASESENDEHQIPGNVDPNKVEEIKRTIYVGNLDSKTAAAEQLLQFFSTCGEVRFVRMAGDETQPTRFAFVEFADTAGVQNALQLNGMLFGDRPIKVNHSNNAIVKPQNKTQETTAKEIEEAMRRVREAQSLISKALEPEVKDRRSGSRSRHRRRRSRSTSRKRRSTSRSRRRRKSRSRSYGRRSRSHRSRSRSRRHRRSRSRSHKRSKSGKRDRSSSRKKEKSKSKSRSRSSSKKSSRHKKDRKRDRESDRDRDSKKRRKRSKSRSSSREGDRKHKDAKNDKETHKKTENGKTEQRKDNDEKEKPVLKPEEEVKKEASIKQEPSGPDAKVTITNGDGIE